MPLKNIQTRTQGIKSLLMVCLLPLIALHMQAQDTPQEPTQDTPTISISIGGNVYGGGNQGAVGTEKDSYPFETEDNPSTSEDESTAIDMTSVTIRCGEIKNVFGGGRMAGVYGNSSVTIDGTTSLGKIILGNVYGGNDIAGEVKGGAKVKSIYNETYTTKPIYIAKLYGGGNGDYTYGQEPVDGLYQVKSGDEVIATSTTRFAEPDIAKVAIKLQSGVYGQVFGGGNKATINTQTDITLNNQTNLSSLAALSATEKTALEAYGWLDEWFTKTGDTYKPTYQFNRVFGGNNKVNMAIRPTWHLTKGTIDNLYSGGNMGGMTYPNGILLAITGNDMVINNVYGGCRMADVNPLTQDGLAPLQEETVDADGLPTSSTPVATFYATYAARVLITGGKITNVYGGNDISGTVYHGTQVEIHHSILGDVYGGGNGSYAYTDNAALKDDPFWGDFYYTIPDGKTSAEALNRHRPNVGQTLLHVKGTSDDITYIGGALYCGGNSATLRAIQGYLTEASANLRIGSYVVARSMFLGSNGENLITGKVHEKVNGSWTDTDILAKYKETEPDFSQMDLTTSADFEEYMKSVEVGIIPSVTFDEDYQGYSSKVGSLYCGGNIGSMSAAGTFNLNFFNHELVIFDKLVGGCNNANVAKSDNNAFHEGGIIIRDPSANSPKVILEINGLKLEPRKLTYDATNNTYSLDWNKTDYNMLIGGNIYGGCYTSGYINGGVTINIKADAISDVVKTAADGTILQTLEVHRDSVLTTALSAFGAGYGEDSEIWGNTVINISDNANIIKVFGGGEMGVVGNLERYTSSSTLPEGKNIGDRTGAIETRYNTTINLNAGNVGKIYGGGFEGPVTGHTTVNLIGGTAYDVIGGACNADIEEYAETYVGRAGASTIPNITNNIYGANDFGGQILGTKDYSTRVSENDVYDKVYNTSLLSAAAYVEYIKGKAKYIFGGAKAAYDYKDQRYYSNYADENGVPIVTLDANGHNKGFVKPAIGNAFVNFHPEYDENSRIIRVYGAGQGYFNEIDKDLLQDNSYVLIDIPADAEQFATLEVFGAGDYSGVGMKLAAADVRDAEAASATDVTAAAVIDLVRGKINSVYGGSYKEGFTRRTIVNVPVASTINMNYLYGGAYGVEAADGNPLGNLYPCDVYESNVNFKSADARVRTIYGGNNSYRRTLYTHVNIYAPVQYRHQTFGDTHANIFGAGYGENTWAQYTEVNLFDGAKVFEPYGGGENGCVFNKESIDQLADNNGWNLAIPGDYSTTDASYDHGGLGNNLAHSNQLFDDYKNKSFDANFDGNNDINVAEKYNTNVHIHRGANVVNYAYGAGLGSHIYTYQFDGNIHDGNTQPLPSHYIATAETPDQLDPEARAKYDAALAAYNTYNDYIAGSTVGANEYNSFNDTQKSHWTQIGHRTTAVVSGTSYIDLLGGTVNKDLYAAGTTGSVQDTLMIKSFIASSTAYIKGGTARNVYGGGWEGPVGKHDMSKPGTYLDKDVLGVANVIVGRPEEEIAADYATALADDPSLDKEEFYFYNGVPAITRNAYAGGEGGVIRGTANLNIFNGLVGYRFKHKDNITESEKNYYKIETDDSGKITYTALLNDGNLDLTDETYLYVEEIDQDAVGDNIMYEAGNAFGGGYAANSDVDIANLTLWDGIIRNSMYGGGEIATIGRGTQAKNTSTNEFDVTIYKPGQTHVTMMGGHVLRDVFGGGRGFNNWKTEDKTEGNTNGYIFGQTDVNIHFGTIGTPDGISKGYGNVFGGGNIGFVYSQYPKKGDGWYYEDYSNKTLSEDTRVEVKVYGKALETVEIDGTAYNERDYIPNTKLDKLTNDGDYATETSPATGDKAKWAKIDQSGITIYNAVFAGGNVSAGSDKIMAFSKTVYGNSTASVVDIYSRDLVSVGGSGVGGLYGDGNLTFVDGYRELNITNYGSDYWTLSRGVPSEEVFNALTPRQQSFYLTQYRCTTPYGSYDVGDIIMSDVYNSMSDEDKANWTRQKSMVTEGRYINTLQRCDFCGIKGSRIVLHGAIDRAQDESEADYTNYTINRVGELSLNQNTGPGNTESQRNHGSYFGIYNVVKFLGGVTSDVRFTDVRKTTSTASEFRPTSDNQTYYDWKQAHISENVRNDGTAPNKIALASGVFLEIVEKLDPNGNKVYGPITGVVELDLLNVSPGEGGGYVYAKNIHGAPSYNSEGAFAGVISDANAGLVTNRAFTYATALSTDEMQTSGNFIHSQPKRILDDCFPNSKSYYGTGASPAHYWYIRGEFYVYEQLLSAYTGGANSYSAETSIPLTMAIQGNAKLRLLNVVPGLYADPAKLTHYQYNADNPELSVSDSISFLNNAIIKTYGQGDPISYWDWYNATSAERSMFVVENNAMVCNTEATIDGTTYYPGQTISKSTYDGLGDTASDSEGNTIVDNDGLPVDPKTFFSVVNEVSNDNGYLLTIDFSNPSKWDDYYRHLVDETGDPIKKAKLQELLDECGDNETARKELLEAYVKSATFKCKDEGVYGQYHFYESQIISHNVYEMETAVAGHVSSEKPQATFVPAYMAKEDCEVSVGNVLKSFTKGTPISATDYGYITSGDTYFEPAYICVNTVLVSNGDYRVLNQLVGEEEYNSWSTLPDIQGNFQPAYFCTSEGSWGGKYYEEGHNYNGLDYGQLLEGEREHFDFNYDALDALYYNDYEDNDIDKYAYDAVQDYIDFINNVGGTNRNAAISVFDKEPNNNPFYVVPARIDYQATFNSDDAADKFIYVKDANITVNSGTTLDNEKYEDLPNDRMYYAGFAVSDDHLKKMDGSFWNDGYYHTFIVKNTFDVAGTMYNAGKSITHADYSSLLPQQQANVKEVKIPYTDIVNDNYNHGAGTYFFCIEEYTVGANDNNITKINGTPIDAPTEVNDIDGVHSYIKGTSVPVGTVIDKITMLSIPNYQLHFDIHGEVPIEETTLYVPVTADIEALQKDRYVTAIYEYSYTESDAQGLNYERRVEKHILNIRIKFLSGTPIIGPLKEPDLVLPLEKVGFDIPAIQEGAFPILGGGWEIYSTEDNAKHHRNGREYINGGEPLYFYQNDYYVAYYASTRMGKTFSEAVPLHVANYQRMADVINNPNHMYINHRDNDRDPKIYIDSRSRDTYDTEIRDKDEADVVREYNNELDAMQAMWRIVNTGYGTQYNEEVDGKPGRNITGAKNLEFFLQSEVGSELTSWTSIGDDTQCFGGKFHGNGNAVTGLNNSLFGNLCGRVYNLGVMGNFTAGGIANTGDGHIENCWVWSSAPTLTGRALYATPGSGARVINSYYPESNNFPVTESNGNLEITQRPVEDFVNGSVAYDLNRYYLEARYRLFGKKDGAHEHNIFYRLPDGTFVKNTDQITDVNGKQPGETGYIETYDLIEDANGKQPNETGYIRTFANQDYTLKYTDEDKGQFDVDYVKDYVKDGDFRFCDGNKPLKADLRLSSKHGYLPIYPDDYIFFGQKLSYDILIDANGDTIKHVTHPQAAAKSHTTGSDEDVDNSKHRLLINDINDRSENRIFRAPAYFRNGVYNADRNGDGKGDGSVIFNARAAFVDSYNFKINGTDYTSTPHRGMTAIDFTGGNGDTKGYQGVVAGLDEDFTDRANGYGPLLDYERLDAFQTQGLTQNLLAYTPKADLPGSKNTQTNSVLVDYFRDIAYSETNENYRNVAVQNTSIIKGHVVQQASTDLTNGNYTYQATLDHLLVDKQDFNAPMAYTFATGKRMWYQRTPDNYVDLTKGWEGISIPFEAELVTTQDKGEITHFYKKSDSNKYERGYDSGHEYWLRKFAGNVKEKKDEDNNTVEGVYTADFNYPVATGNKTKNYANTFLWDYYYSQNPKEEGMAGQDANTDEYQKEDNDRKYYSEGREYGNYPYATAGTPYIIGFPGQIYYEFDLSGTFVPANTLEPIAKLDKQVITFASPTGASIAVSDTEMTGVTPSGSNYTFKPSYLNEKYTTAEAKIFVLNGDGSSFDNVNGTTEAPVVSSAFRPYFTKKSSNGAPRRIIINDGSNTSLTPEFDERYSGDPNGGLKISVEGRNIVVKSTRRDNATVRITTTSGIVIKTFTIEPGQVVRTPVNMTGVYITNRTKVVVK